MANSAPSKFATPAEPTTRHQYSSNGARKRELRLSGMKYRSTWPKAPRHNKHTVLQGFPNTRGFTK